MPETARIIDITEVDQKDAELEKKALQVIDIRSAITVVDNDSMALADELKKKCREVIKLIDDEYQPIAKSAFDHHRNITAKWNAKKKPYQDFEVTLTNQVKTYLRKVREEEERQAAILREQARKEEEERRLAQAAELEASGNVEEANAILDEPMTYVAPVPVIQTPKVDGRLYRTQLKAKVTDRAAFLNAIRPLSLLELMTEQAWAGIESGLSRKAKTLGRAFNMPGVTLTEQ